MTGGEEAVAAVEEEEDTMSAAAAEGGVKPLQNAMKMAKNAIQLDGESRSKVRKVDPGMKRKCVTETTGF